MKKKITMATLWGSIPGITFSQKLLQNIIVKRLRARLELLWGSRVWLPDLDNSNNSPPPRM